MKTTHVKAHKRNVTIDPRVEAVAKRMQLKTTGAYKLKPYECTRCAYRAEAGTNHWGEFYDRCPNCSWKYPLDPTVTWKCLEPTPQGYTTPQPWKKVKLGDIAQIKLVSDVDDYEKAANKIDQTIGNSIPTAGYLAEQIANQKLKGETKKDIIEFYSQKYGMTQKALTQMVKIRQ